MLLIQEDFSGHPQRATCRTPRRSEAAELKTPVKPPCNYKVHCSGDVRGFWRLVQPCTQLN